MPYFQCCTFYCFPHVCTIIILLCWYWYYFLSNQLRRILYLSSLIFSHLLISFSNILHSVPYNLTVFVLTFLAIFLFLLSPKQYCSRIHFQCIYPKLMIATLTTFWFIKIISPTFYFILFLKFHIYTISRYDLFTECVILHWYISSLLPLLF